MPLDDLSRLRIDRERPGSRRVAAGIFVALAILALAAGVATGWRQLRPATGRAQEVELGTATRRAGGAARGISANGYVVARRRAALSTDVTGTVVELLVEEGDRVEEGDLIARLDTRALEAARAGAEAERESAEAGARLAELELARLERLGETEDATAAEVDGARAERDAARARVEALAAAAREIGVRIEKSSLRAPFAGVVVEKNAEVGEVVASATGAGPNARGAVVTVVDFSTLEVQVELAQTSLGRALLGAPVVLHLDAFPAAPYRGRIRQIWPTANRQKATVEVRVEILDADRKILPEMGVRVVFLEEETSSSASSPPPVRVPSRSVVPTNPPSIFVYREGTVSRREVRLGSAPAGGNDSVVVEEGLAGHEVVVLDPPAGLRDGDAVVPKREVRP